MLINRQPTLDSFCRQLAEAAVQRAAPLALDTEFVSERRYAPKLCLVQVCAGTVDPTAQLMEAVIDPLAVKLAPLLQLIEDPTVVKVLHSGSVDLRIFFQEFGCRPTNVFDTQIAAAFLGFGH